MPRNDAGKSSPQRRRVAEKFDAEKPHGFFFFSAKPLRLCASAVGFPALKVFVAAVSQRPPDWVVAGWTEYARRMPRELALELLQIRPEPRTSGKTAEAMMALEATRIEAQLPGGCRRIALDEHGDAPTTRQLAERLAKWMASGDDVAFIIGGPDGLDARIRNTAHETMRLSSLTLPHALVRVILAEALYRASSVIKCHPYHRD